MYYYCGDVTEVLTRSKNRKRNLAKLQGKGLGEASDNEEEDSALNWIKKSRKRERDLAARRAREIEEMDSSYQEYDSNNLAGLKVSHSMKEFEEGGETILTLKDRGILDENDEEADELTNVNLEDRERLKKNLEAKKQKPGYNPYDDDQFNGIKRSILPQYEDEDEEGGFVIGRAGTINKVIEKEDEKTVAQKLKEQNLSYEKMQEIKDYYTQEEVNATFKKPKSKKKKKMRRKTNDEDDIVVNSVVEEQISEPTRSRTIEADANFVDDDDLQEALARARRVANKQKSKMLKKMTPEEIAKKIREEEEGKMDEDEDDKGLVLSETTEFVSSLGNNIPSFATRESAVHKEVKKNGEEAHMSKVKVEDIEMEEASHTQDVKMEEVEEDFEEEDFKQEEEKDIKEEPIVEEPLVSGGLAATLALLNQKGEYSIHKFKCLKHFT